MKPLRALDLETTGTSVTQDAILQIGIYEPFIVEKQWLVKSWKPIPKEATDCHGITNEMVAKCLTFARVAQNIYEHLADCDLLVFNGYSFDVPLLYEEFARCGIEWNLDGANIIDAGNIFKRKEERTLSAAVKFYCGREHVGAHGALADCIATSDIYWEQLMRYFLADEVSGKMRATRENLARYSRYDEDRLSFDGKIILKDGVAVFNFGKHEGKPVLENVDYAQWMLSADFPAHTKSVLRKIIT